MHSSGPFPVAHVDTVNLFARRIREGRGHEQILCTTVASKTFRDRNQAYKALQDGLGTASYHRVAQALNQVSETPNNPSAQTELMLAEAALKLEHHSKDSWRTFRKLATMHQILGLMREGDNKNQQLLNTVVENAFSNNVFKTRTEFDETLQKYINRDSFTNNKHVSEFLELADTAKALQKARKIPRKNSEDLGLSQRLSNWWGRLIGNQKGQSLRAKDIINSIGGAQAEMSLESSQYFITHKENDIEHPTSNAQPKSTDKIPSGTLNAITEALLAGGEYLPILRSFAGSTGKNFNWALDELKKALPDLGYDDVINNHTKAALILHRLPKTARQTLAQLHVHRILSNQSGAIETAFNTKFGSYFLFSGNDFDSLMQALRVYSFDKVNPEHLKTRAKALIDALKIEWEKLPFQERYFFGVTREKLVKMAIKSASSPAASQPKGNP